jgi:hypothetical protein
MDRIARRESGWPQVERARAQSVALGDRKDLVHDAEQSIEGGLDGIAALDRNLTMQDLLQHLGVGNQPLSGRDGALERAPGVELMRMRCADQVHRDIRVDEDHSASVPG